MSKTLPVVTIVGRPNVGKSTLFNRLVGKRRSITLDTPGVTRDPIHAEVEWDGRRLRIVDTGGLGGEAEIALADRVHEHTVQSIREADAAIVVFDARAGLAAFDAETVDLLKRAEIPLIFVANKCEGPAQEDALGDFCALGIDPPEPVSAEHGRGIVELRERVVAALEPPEPAGESGIEQADPGEIRVAIVGRPNVGKSSLLNAIAGSVLSLVDDTPGTTRDAVDTRVTYGERRYVLIDTAGMRRPSRVAAGVERLSVGRSLDAIRRSDVVVLLIDPEEGMIDQETRIAQVTLEEGRALVIALNKIDLLPRGATREEVKDKVAGRYPTLGIAEFEAVSAKTGQGIERLFRAIDRARDAHALEVQTAGLNRVLQDVLAVREPPVLGRGRLKIFYATQTGTRPPAFTFFANRESVPQDYRRFVESQIRAAIPLRGTPIRLRFRRRESHGADRE
jgi:GTP-binding protein